MKRLHPCISFPSYLSLQVTECSLICLKRYKPSFLLSNPEALQIQNQLSGSDSLLVLILLNIKLLPQLQASYPHFTLPDTDRKVEQ